MKAKHFTYWNSMIILKQKKVGVAVLEPYDKKPQLLTVLLTPDYKELLVKYNKLIVIIIIYHSS